MIVSISRRCDIPRFAFAWFLERLDAGFVEVRNPFNYKQIRRVSLLPPPANPGATEDPKSTEYAESDEYAEIFAFWTRNPVFILKHAEDLERRGYAFFVMTTLNSYPALLEPNVPPAEEILRNMAKLAKKTSPDRVMWRYDPIFLSNLTDYEFHVKNFASLAERLGGIVKRVIVSVYDEYPRAEKRIARLEKLQRLPHYDIDAQGAKSLAMPLKNLLTELGQIARRNGMEIQGCAELEPASGINSGACIDGEYVSKIFGIKNPGKDRSQKRPNCLCAKSVDIGAYGNCPAGCVYCYASS